MNVTIHRWNREVYSGEIKTSAIVINGHKVDIDDIEMLTFCRIYFGPDANSIEGTLKLKDSSLPFRIREKGFFTTRGVGNLEGYVCVHVKSLQTTYRIEMHQIESIVFRDDES